MKAIFFAQAKMFFVSMITILSLWCKLCVITRLWRQNEPLRSTKNAPSSSLMVVKSQFTTFPLSLCFAAAMPEIVLDERNWVNPPLQPHSMTQIEKSQKESAQQVPSCFSFGCFYWTDAAKWNAWMIIMLLSRESEELTFDIVTVVTFSVRNIYVL